MAIDKKGSNNQHSNIKESLGMANGCIKNSTCKYRVLRKTIDRDKQPIRIYSLLHVGSPIVLWSMYSVLMDLMNLHQANGHIS